MDLESLKVSSTVVVISKDKKALIVQRPPNKSFANLWTVAGGKLQDTDGILDEITVIIVEKETEKEEAKETW